MKAYPYFWPLWHCGGLLLPIFIMYFQFVEYSLVKTVVQQLDMVWCHGSLTLTMTGLNGLIFKFNINGVS